MAIRVMPTHQPHQHRLGHDLAALLGVASDPHPEQT
jgi:hypothetical protein